MNPDIFKFEVCHHENIKWGESIVFYAEECNYFKKLLEEVADKNTDVLTQKEVAPLKQTMQELNDQLYHLALGIINQEKIFAEYAKGERFLFDEQIELIHQRQQVAFDQTERNFLRNKKMLYNFLKKVL
jgi:hypothetical protein